MVQTQINTHTHGIYLMQAQDELKNITGMDRDKIKKILPRLFRQTDNKKNKLLNLNTSDFFAFVINNIKQLKIDFKEVTTQMGGAQSSIVEPITAPFVIPEMETYKFSEVKELMYLRLNAYREYTNEFLVDPLRSMSERLFENYCETAPSVKWVYKNGDSGQQYLSIVYTNYFSYQKYFYPDYILSMKDGSTWIIETKGGEQAGHSKNIDKNVENKFVAFKDFAEKYNLNWGFVRDIDGQLFLNNTKYTEAMIDNPEWKPLHEAF